MLTSKLELILQFGRARLRHAREAEGFDHPTHRAALVLRRLEDASGVAVLYPRQLRLLQRRLVLRVEDSRELSVNFIKLRVGDLVLLVGARARLRLRRPALAWLSL